MGKKWLRGGGESSECGVSAGTTERRRCQESDVTDEKPALEVEIIAAMAFAGNDRFSLLDAFGLDNPQELSASHVGPKFSIALRFRFRYALALHYCRQAHL